MAFNKFMHERNIYKDKPPNFIELSELFPNFKKYLKFSCKKKPFLNFKDPNALKELTTCLLEKDFGLKVSLPDDRLIPTIPSRLNYLHWIEDLFQCFPETLNQRRILDIGCGCCCVYPLLASKLNPDWKFVATETDEKNFEYATKNVLQNNLEEKIKIFKVDDNEKLLEDHKFDICICNPPFFNTENEVESSKNRPQANSVCNGSKNEMISNGGDFAFGLKIFNESKSKKDVGWFTIMLGKKESFLKLKKLIVDDGIECLASTELCQGNTMRWALGWSFNSQINKNKIPKSMFLDSKKERKPIKIESKFLFLNETVNEIQKYLSNLNILFETEILAEDKVKIKIRAKSKSWLHNRRKRRQLAFCDVIKNKIAKLENGGHRLIDNNESIPEILPTENNQKLLNETEITKSFEEEISENKKDKIVVSNNQDFKNSDEILQNGNLSLNNKQDYVLECSVEVVKIMFGPVELYFSCNDNSQRNNMNDLIVSMKGKV